MSGHSKWATTKYRKGAQDKARAKIFAKCIRLVEVAAREGGGGDLEANATLRTAYQKATRAASVPLDTIEKAIKRGTGDLRRACGTTRPSSFHEGYGPGGVAIIVEVLSRQPQPHGRRASQPVQPQRRQHGRARRRLVAVRAARAFV